MIRNLTMACVSSLLFCAAPASAQFDAEGMGLLKGLNDCIQRHAFEEDDGIKLPATIADQSLAKCEAKSQAVESYFVRHSVKMTDKVRGDLQKVRHDMAVKFVHLNRRAGLIHAPN